MHAFPASDLDMPCPDLALTGCLTLIRTTTLTLDPLPRSQLSPFRREQGWGVGRQRGLRGPEIAGSEGVQEFLVLDHARLTLVGPGGKGGVTCVCGAGRPWGEGWGDGQGVHSNDQSWS